MPDNGIDTITSASKSTDEIARHKTDSPAVHSSAHTSRPNSDKGSLKILRFRKSERYMHWALAIPFLVCYASSAILVFHYNPDPSRAYRDLFSWIHRISGICLIVLPMLAAYYARGDMRLHFYNVAQAWKWAFDDVKWLLLKGVATFNKKLKLPDQGKFNAAEKLNFMVLMATYPLYVLTGLAMWLTYSAVLSWIVHVLMALLATPLILGHIYMAVINPATRKGLSGMFTGKVDRDWAKHHYTLWYNDHFEENGSPRTRAVGNKSAVDSTSDISNDDVAEFEKAMRVLQAKAGEHADLVRLNYYLALASEESGHLEQAVEKYTLCLTDWRGEEANAQIVQDAKVRLAKLLKAT